MAHGMSIKFDNVMGDVAENLIAVSDSSVRQQGARKYYEMVQPQFSHQPDWGA